MPEVLRMLKRALDPIKSEWDMRFVESAPGALAALEQEAFDVLATDMIRSLVLSIQAFSQFDASVLQGSPLNPCGNTD